MRKARYWLMAGALAAALAVYYFGVRPRLGADSRLARQADEGAIPRVDVAYARRLSVADVITLPAALQAYVDTPIHARTSGYVEKWTADIGSRVKAGQTLAVIESPEVDQQLSQARANLDQARSNLEIARVTAERWEELGRRNAVAIQEVDQKAAAYASRKADLGAAQAEVDRLVELQRFERVTAPFDGVISVRNIDVGTLINAGGGSELFHLTQNDVIRVYISVPQSYFRAIRTGLPVDVLVSEFPTRVFSGRIVRSAAALDAATRTLLTEVQIPNPAGELLPGMFGQARLSLSGAATTLVLASNTIVVRPDGMRVAEVGAGNRIAFRKVTLGRDFGSQVEILSGLAEGAMAVSNPGDTLSEGMVVEPVQPRHEPDGTP